MRFLLSATAIGLGLFACVSQGDQGPAGGPGAAGAAGAAGSAGPAGSGGPTGDAGGVPTVVVLSARAKAGLDASPVPVNINGLSSADVEKIGYGSYLMNAIGDCNRCHGSTDSPPKFLAGGQKFDLSGGNFVYAKNITTGGPALSEADFISAFQTGTDPAKKSEALLVMPWEYYRWMSVEDLKAMYGYLKAIPAVTNPVSSDSKGALAKPPVPLATSYNDGDADPDRTDLPADGSTDPNSVLRGLAIQPLVTPPGFGNAAPPDGGSVASIPDQERFGRGSYLVNSIGACSSCHTNPARIGTKINTAAYLSGGQVFNVPAPLASVIHQKRNMSQNLSGRTHGYTDSYAAFLSIFDQGIHSLDSQKEAVGWPMPWQTLRNMVPEDQEAIYTYILNVPLRTGSSDKETTSNVEWCAATSDCTWNPGETCNTANNECVGMACTADTDCSACQKCTVGHCVAPIASSACVSQGI